VELGISFGSCQAILTTDLCLRLVPAKSIPQTAAESTAGAMESLICLNV